MIQQMIESIPSAARTNIHLSIVDNSGEITSSDFGQFVSSFDQLDVLSPNENLGYFGGADYAVKAIGAKLKKFASVLIVNPDIIFDGKFFSQLAIVLDDAESAGAIFPTVFDTNEQCDMNPFLASRPPKSFLDTRIRAFSNRLTFLFWNLASMFKRKLASVQNTPVNNAQSVTEIYAGHGALMIFTPDFFRLGGTFERPTFLYSEELFIAEQCRQVNLICVHYPELKTTHVSHATTSLVPGNSRRVWALESLKHIRDSYY